VEQRFGVAGPVLVAFWGLESDFGATSGMGRLSVLPSITTLAYDCRRPEMFRPELFAALQIIDRGDLTPAEMVGSWAGELGQTQFLPTLWVKYGIDFDGDGRRDLIRNVADVMGSTGNYLADVGWKRGEPWMQEVRAPSNLPWDQADLAIQHPRSQWARWGVTYADGRALPADNLAASLLLPMGRFGPAFLVYDNFKVYRIWNASLVYATTAAYYATRLAGAPPMRGPASPIPNLSPEQIRELQLLLTQRGHDVGKVDGILGAQSRTAVKAMQMRYGLPADSWPTAELLDRMRARQ
jgi:lytic murein transglycosylase